MFEWLADEMAKIKTRKFHLVDGPAAPELREAVEESDSGLPLSYKSSCSYSEMQDYTDAMVTTT